MLILSRREDESFVILIPPSHEKREIRVMVTGVFSRAVRLGKGHARFGITAPQDCVILRNELEGGLHSVGVK